jgi:hypothetical protein
MKFFGTAIVFVCLAMAATIIHAHAQGVYIANPGMSVGAGTYWPSPSAHYCTYSTETACAAWRNGAGASGRAAIVRRKVRR